MLIDILQIINSFLFVKDQLNLKKTNKFINKNLSLYFGKHNNIISPKYLTQEILKKKLNIVELTLTDNVFNINLNSLKNLRYLKLNGFCKIGYSSIKKLKYIYYLDISYNIYLKKLPKSNIRILHLVGNVVIFDKDIEHLDLIELDCSFNMKITKISHFQNLEKLIICYQSSIKEDEINKCKNLKYLDITGNPNIDLNLIANKNITIIQ